MSLRFKPISFNDIEDSMFLPPGSSIERVPTIPRSGVNPMDYSLDQRKALSRLWRLSSVTLTMRGFSSTSFITRFLKEYSWALFGRFVSPKSLSGTTQPSPFRVAIISAHALTLRDKGKQLW